MIIIIDAHSPNYTKYKESKLIPKSSELYPLYCGYIMLDGTIGLRLD